LQQGGEIARHAIDSDIHSQIKARIDYCSGELPMRRALMMSAPLWLLALAAATQTQAEDARPATAPADEITVIATRSEKKVFEVPATVSVITARQIEDDMVTDIKDLVRFEPGVSVRSSPARFTAAGSSTGRDGNSGFNIRGLEGNRVLIQIDGIRVPDAFSFGAQAAGRGDYVGLDLLKSVEILRGPASALYGSDGVAGAVSYVTKDPADFLKNGKNFGGQFKVGYSEADDSTGKGVVLAGRTGKLQAMVAYTRRDGSEQKTQGENDTASALRTTANPQDVFTDASMAKIVYTPVEGHRFGLTFDRLAAKTQSQVLSAVTATTLKLDALDSTRRQRISLDYHFKGAGLIDAADVVAYYQDSHSSQYAFEDRTPAVDRSRLNLFDTEVSGLNAQAYSDVQAGTVTHKLVYGLDYSQSKQVSVRDGTVPPAGETYPTRAFPTTDFTLTGAFIQDEIALFADRLLIYPALRYDSYELSPKADALLTTLVPQSQDGSRVSPKLSTLFKATEHVSLFLNYAEGYKAPTPNQVNNAFANLVSNYKSVPNPDLRPETSKTIEGGLRLKADGWYFSLTGFSGEYEDFIDQVMVGGAFTAANPAIYQFINLSGVKISGLESSLNARLSDSFSLKIAASSSRGRSLSGGVAVPLASVDPFKLVTGLNYRDNSGRFGGQFIVTHSAAKDGEKTGCTPSPTACYVPPAFTTADLTAWWDVTANVTLRAGVFNLTDETYSWWSDVRGLASTSLVKDNYTQPGRNGSVSLVVKF
jgi:hemoglobin/transferrin/lactoferrin receptor protein